MSLISKELWESEFPNMPMPKNCTYQQFSAAAGFADKEAERELSLKLVADLMKLKELRPDDESVVEYCNREIANELGGLNEL